MAHAGQVIQGPHTKITFLQTATDTRGAHLTFTQAVQPGSPATPEHCHTKQMETFRVLRGKMGVRAGDLERILSVGDSVTLSAGVSHTMWNAGEEVLEQEIRLEPALNAETFFETVVGLEQDGQIPDGKPTFAQALQFALIAPYYHNPLGTVPMSVQRVMFGLLTPFAYLLGYRPWYPKYSPHGPVILQKERQSARKAVHHVK